MYCVEARVGDLVRVCAKLRRFRPKASEEDASDPTIGLVINGTPTAPPYVKRVYRRHDPDASVWWNWVPRLDLLSVDLVCAE